MQEVSVIMVAYHPEQRIVLLETKVRAYPYLVPTNGYKIEEEKDDWLILSKSESVSVTVKVGDEAGTPSYDVVKLVCEFYQEEKMSYELFNRFYNDVINESIKLYLDDDENKLIII